MRVRDNAVLNTEGSFLVEDDLRADDNASITLGGTARINNDLNVNDNSAITITGNLYVADNMGLDNNADITITSTALVEVIGALEHDGDDLTVNRALVIRDVNNDGSFLGNGEAILGSGLIQIDGSGLDNNGGTITGTLDICSSDASSNPLSGNNPSGSVTICTSSGINFPIIPAAPLPVSLLDFDAYLNDKNQVELVWITASELNNDFFTIERSGEDLNFIAIENIPGKGTTNETNQYNFFDSKPLNGLSYYRLKQTDYDGRTETFEMIG